MKTSVLRSVICHVLALGGATLGLAVLEAQEARAQIMNRPFAIVGRASGKCLNVSGESTANDAPIVQWACQNEPNALWTLAPVGDAFELVANHSGKCADVYDASMADEAPVVQYSCTGNPNQLWKIEPLNGAFRLRAKHSNKCLNVYSDDHANGGGMIQWPCVGNDNELWSMSDGFVSAAQGFRLVPKSKLCVESKLVSGAWVPVQSNCLARATQGQDWTFTRLTAGSVSGYQVASGGRCLAATSTTDGAALSLTTCQLDVKQLWDWTSAGSVHHLVNAFNGKCADTLGSTVGVTLVQKSCSTANTQQLHVVTNGTMGEWGDFTTLPLVPAAAALVYAGTDTRVLTWSAWDAYTYTGGHGQTTTALFDPASPGTVAFNVVTRTHHDMFCPGTALLADGRLLVNGGRDDKKTSIYTPSSGTWDTSGEMGTGRAYNASVTMGNGKVFTIGGSWNAPQSENTPNIPPKDGELFDPSTGQWTALPNAPAALMEDTTAESRFRSDNHAWLFSLSNDTVFHAGPKTQMNWYSTSGPITKPPATRSTDSYSMNGNAVMYDVRRILKLGGAPRYDKADPATKKAYIINLDSGGAQTTQTGFLKYARAFVNSVVLPDGRVLAVGGSEYAKPFADDKAVLAAEVYDSQTGAFTLAASMGTPRTYHSVALLLPDGRVLSGGGGLCSIDCPTDTNHPDIQYYSPDYLFKTNGDPAVRPKITAGPSVIGYGTSIPITTDVAATRFALVRMSSVTHSTNNDQRRVPLTINSSSGFDYSLAAPSDSGVAPPGYYMLFALDALGVPSIARIVRVG